MDRSLRYILRELKLIRYKKLRINFLFNPVALYVTLKWHSRKKIIKILQIIKTLANSFLDCITVPLAHNLSEVSCTMKDQLLTLRLVYIVVTLSWQLVNE